MVLGISLTAQTLPPRGSLCARHLIGLPVGDSQCLLWHSPNWTAFEHRSSPTSGLGSPWISSTQYEGSLHLGT